MVPGLRDFKYVNSKQIYITTEHRCFRSTNLKIISLGLTTRVYLKGNRGEGREEDHNGSAMWHGGWGITRDR